MYIDCYDLLILRNMKSSFTHIKFFKKRILADFGYHFSDETVNFRTVYMKLFNKTVFSTKLMT